jgi:hypothetical protein
MVFVTPAMRTLDPVIRRFIVHDAIAFQVIDSQDGDSARGQYTGNLAGVIRPLLDWETKLVPANVTNNGSKVIVTNNSQLEKDSSLSKQGKKS